ncbi:uncharacterized protein LAESUDRAFT_701420 [Laetiporus sulphureus 93-53]|uniref:Uncharacterized protein n=1 Tax=Laetiporus sulphureus 93-53 TaxID=1314785 RepID=A0A165DZE4_9APHY|nr:uncharacterized protein LAESUDRAFT_701420 [Laetiporus sulphureus 93-53]KZT05950.1 hypothetical protein LAESUDRAFT_701420 [Laetiporus sulphureus 93-53]
MPTSTVPYEVLLEFSNDTIEPVTLQVLRHDSGSRTGATIFLHSGESISLVLTAGLPYKYAAKLGGREAMLSVKVWQDSRCNLSDVASESDLLARKCDGVSRVVMEGISVASLVETRATIRR